MQYCINHHHKSTFLQMTSTYKYTKCDVCVVCARGEYKKRKLKHFVLIANWIEDLYDNITQR